MQLPQYQNTSRSKEKLGRLLKKDMIRILIQSRSDKDPDEARRLQWGDHWVKYELRLAFSQLDLLVVDENPDVILHLFGSPAKKLPEHTYNVVWLYSHPDLVTDDNLGEFDKIFCASPSFTLKLQKMGCTNVETMIPSTAKRPIQAPLRHEIIFVGNARSSRSDGRAVVHDLRQCTYDFKVWGNLWEKILPEKHYGGRYWDYRELEKLYASAKITLTDHHPDMAREGFVSNKVFDILASGGFAISDGNKGIEEIFRDAVPQYESDQHLQELLGFYLSHPAARKELMLKGRKIALTNTYKDRAIRIAQDFLPLTKKGLVPPLSSQRQKRKGGRKILYIDLFREENSNFFWLKAFQKYGVVQKFDIREDIRTLAPLIASFKPDHIHLGGSVKKGIIGAQFLVDVKVESGCTISVFYGDGRYSTYHFDLSKVSDYVYITNKTHIERNRGLGLSNFRYLACPTDPEIFRPVKDEKRYDLLFIGNNNSQSRLALLKRISERFDLTVAGAGWKGRGIKTLTEAYGPDFNRLVGQARILLGLMDDEWSGLRACFSNRVVNTLASGGFLIQRYTPELETIFDNREHLVWYSSEEELFSLILHYLVMPEECERIGRQGRELVAASLTYDRAVARILGDVGILGGKGKGTKLGAGISKDESQFQN